MSQPETLDILIVGAGISGIAAAYYLQKRCPRQSWTIVEARDSIGGTWDFFRYPGVRSDSDMFTLGYRFRPWRGETAIAEGGAILQYLRDTAAEFGIDRRIRFGQRVKRISWSSTEAAWTVEIEKSEGERSKMSCKFLFMCTGYYKYDGGYTPQWQGIDDFRGLITHPQRWTEGLDYAGKRVVVIGSGATAVTIVPALAKEAAHVTMLQRSPSYVVSMPATDESINRMRGRLPFSFGAWLARWKMILFGTYNYWLARTKPIQMRAVLISRIRDSLGQDYPVEDHFSPAYDPWDQRICVAADGDLFQAIREGKVTMATAEIERFVEGGIQLKTGETLRADIIVTATGMTMRLLDGIAIQVDGQPMNLNQSLSYKGMMYSDIPNLAFAFGYTNASWTLKAELICEYVCRLLNHMERRGYRQCVPRAPADSELQREPMIDFTSGYVRRALENLPGQGSQAPWKMYQNYVKDLLMMRFGKLDDGALEFHTAESHLTDT